MLIEQTADWILRKTTADLDPISTGRETVTELADQQLIDADLIKAMLRFRLAPRHTADFRSIGRPAGSSERVPDSG